MKTSSAKSIVRAIIRAISNMNRESELAAQYDAAFDGGEWSSAFHGPETYQERISVMLRHIGVTRSQVLAALDAWARLDKSDGQPVAQIVASWIDPVENL